MKTGSVEGTAEAETASEPVTRDEPFSCRQQTPSGNVSCGWSGDLANCRSAVKSRVGHRADVTAGEKIQQSSCAQTAARTLHSTAPLTESSRHEFPTFSLLGVRDAHSPAIIPGSF